MKEVAGKMDISFTVNITLKSFKQAITSPEKLQWQDAIQTKLCNMKDMGVYNILPMLRGTHVLGGRWVFVKKPATGNTPVQFKARYVARVITICGVRGWYINSFDFVAAYLNAKIDTNIWVRPPDGLHIPSGFSFKLRKALYGTRQAGYCWWQWVAARLTTLGYTASDLNKSLYMHESRKAMIWLHIDDSIIAMEDKQLLLQLHDELGKSFKLKWEDTVKSIVGINVLWTNGGYKLCQQQIIESIIENAWDSTPSTKMPLPAKCNLVTLHDDKELTDARDYIGVVGALSYVATGTRPDIAYAVNLLARHAARPGRDHWRCLQHFLGYVHHTKQLSLCLEPQHRGLQLNVLSDASWGGEFSRSTHGFLAQVNGCSVSWCAKRLVTVASSSCHTEVMAPGMAARHGKWIKNLLDNMLGTPTLLRLLCNNSSTIQIVTDSSSNKWTKHSDREFFITNQILRDGTATLEWIPNTEKKADALTKALESVSHQHPTCLMLFRAGNG
ncbi:hypothetical protein O181_025565 [Austropuccinia psidii MF-1]|uniref:Reverse transcriptase Ty1/copia-type domain-containing protein n=1 Tax=Austropuccinia psidii MF-1 TaxID=1389203 RepID=A0A9Q3CMW0_9BASI|nr:hypothetical protein [Austropuccinia psidii MF-1]